MVLGVFGLLFVEARHWNVDDQKLPSRFVHITTRVGGL